MGTNNTYEIFRSVFNSTTDYLNVRDIATLNEIKIASQNIEQIRDLLLGNNLTPPPASPSNPATKLSNIKYATNLPVNLMLDYDENGNGLYTGDILFILTNQKNTKNLNGIKGVQNLKANYILNEWQDFNPEFNYRMAIDHFIFFTGDTQITEIEIDRYKNLPWSEFYKSENCQHIKEIRIPVSMATGLTKVIIKREGISQASIDSILILLDFVGNVGGYVDLRDRKLATTCANDKCCPTNPQPSYNGKVAIQHLLNKNWEIYY